jgi:hypothetical protein
VCIVFISVYVLVLMKELRWLVVGIYVLVYVCMYVCIRVFVYVCVYVCMCVCEGAEVVGDWYV